MAGSSGDMGNMGRNKGGKTVRGQREQRAFKNGLQVEVNRE